MARSQRSISSCLSQSAPLSHPTLLVVDGILTRTCFPHTPLVRARRSRFPPGLRSVSFFFALKETYLGYAVLIFAREEGQHGIMEARIVH
jgi:hypothetical protein